MNRIKFLLLALVFPFAGFASVPLSKVQFHNIAKDTTRITNILIEAEKIPDINERIVTIARQFEGTPYVAHTLDMDKDKELLVVNLDELDCTTFVETVVALALTAGEKRTSWRDYIATLESLRYRRGEMDGYPSRLHYFSDWVLDNSSRGHITEITPDIPTTRVQTKTVDFMSRNADKYPALADSANLAGVKNFEMGYRNHRYSYIPWDKTIAKNVRDKIKSGDIVAFCTKTPGLDVTHLGFIIKDEKGIPHMLHASMSEGRVVLTEYPLSEQLRRGRIPGVRIARIKE